MVNSWKGLSVSFQNCSFITRRFALFSDTDRTGGIALPAANEFSAPAGTSPLPTGCLSYLLLRYLSWAIETGDDRKSSNP
jgi:hypothetical protein